MVSDEVLRAAPENELIRNSMKKADLLLYEAKHAGRARVRMDQ